MDFLSFFSSKSTSDRGVYFTAGACVGGDHHGNSEGGAPGINPRLAIDQTRVRTREHTLEPSGIFCLRCAHVPAIMVPK